MIAPEIGAGLRELVLRFPNGVEELRLTDQLDLFLRSGRVPGVCRPALGHRRSPRRHEPERSGSPDLPAARPSDQRRRESLSAGVARRNNGQQPFHSPISSAIVRSHRGRNSSRTIASVPLHRLRVRSHLPQGAEGLPDVSALRVASGGMESLHRAYERHRYRLGPIGRRAKREWLFPRRSPVLGHRRTNRYRPPKLAPGAAAGFKRRA